MATPYAASESSSTTHEFAARSVRRHQSTSSTAVESDQPWTATSAAITSSLIAGASSTVAGRTRKPSSGDELIESLGEVGEIAELARRRRLVPFAVAVDPDRAQPELVRRCDVVEVTLGDMHMPFTRRAGLLEEARPVPVLGLVRPDLGCDDCELERDADALHGRLDEVAVGVGENCELPAAGTRILECRRHLPERPPGGQRLGQSGDFVFRCTELAHCIRHDLSVGARTTGLKRRLELVVAAESLVRLVLAEDTRQLAADAAVPIDERAIAVERRPAVSRHCRVPSLRSV